MTNRCPGADANGLISVITARSPSTHRHVSTREVAALLMPPPDPVLPLAAAFPPSAPFAPNATLVLVAPLPPSAASPASTLSTVSTEGGDNKRDSLASIKVEVAGSKVKDARAAAFTSTTGK
jgi:hypothetical protein